MHEMALAEGILEVVLRVSEGRAVRQVRVRAGAVQRVVPDSLQFCFELVSADSAAADARLIVEIVPARLRCRRCHAETEQTSPPFLCGLCSDADVTFLAGTELLVDGVETDGGWRFRPSFGSRPPVSSHLETGHLDEHARTERDVLPQDRIT